MEYEKIGLNGKIIDLNGHERDKYGLVRNINGSYDIKRGKNSTIGTLNIEEREEIIIIEILLDDEKLSGFYEYKQIPDSIIETLKLIYRDKKYLSIRLDSRYIIYNHHFKNKYNYPHINENEYNRILKNLLTEMIDIEENLSKWNLSWTEEASNPNFVSYFDDEIKEKYEKELLTIPEIFIKSDKIIWSNIKTNNSIRTIEFNRNGTITLRKTSRDRGKMQYDISYDVLSDYLQIETTEFFETVDNYIAETYFEDNQSKTIIEDNDIKEIMTKSLHQKKLIYKRKTYEKSSEVVELFLDKKGKIRRCYIEFRTHKALGNITGTYKMKILPRYNSKLLTLNFISRDGKKHKDFGKQILEQSPKIYYELKNGHLTEKLIEKIIAISISIINKEAEKNNRKKISNKDILKKMRKSEKGVDSLMRQISSELPIKSLSERVEKRVQKKSNQKQKQLK